MSGRVVLVGAGPGDPDLLTVRAEREIGCAEVLLYDALIDPVVLELAGENCERIDVGKRGDGTRGVSQDEIADLMIARARAGKRVVRLKGGDPFVFGRGGEEAGALSRAGVEFELVPGVSSALAVPAYAGIPVTDRRWSSSVAVVTGHRGRLAYDERIDWEGLAGSAETLVVLMGTVWLDDIARRLVEGGRDPATPAAVIASGTSPEQRVVSERLDRIAERVREAGIRPPTVVVVGEVARFRESLAWFERRPLFGLRVLVGRAAHQRRELVLELRRRGARPVCVPLIGFEPAADPAALARALAEPSRWDWLVFTSANAVEFAAASLPPEGPGKARVACLGSATASAARTRGWSVAAQPERASTAEALLEPMESIAPLAGAKVLFPRAAEARDALPRALERAGARLTDVEAYRTVLPAGAPERLREELARGLDAVVLTSPSTVRHLFAAIDPSEADRLRSRARFACIGDTTAAAADDAGIRRYALASAPSGPALV
ncbi:MAG: uroporphyrinogen-III C-methyltransferase, partial [Proteobacteria bacterium]|nr:uroporphyrinogen-III C-methyltransferase [Pseudomonadota bacterium]